MPDLHDAVMFVVFILLAYGIFTLISTSPVARKWVNNRRGQDTDEAERILGNALVPISIIIALMAMALINNLTQAHEGGPELDNNSASIVPGKF